MTDQLLALLDQEEVLEGAEESGFSFAPLLPAYPAAARAVWEEEEVRSPHGKNGTPPLSGASAADDLPETAAEETLPLLAQMQAMDRAGQALALGGAAGQREGGTFSPLPLPGNRVMGGAGGNSLPAAGST